MQSFSAGGWVFFRGSRRGSVKNPFDVFMGLSDSLVVSGSEGQFT